MELNPEAFNDFLGAIGQDFTWRKAFICPCVSPGTQQAKLDCPQCKGKSYIWAAPVPGTAGLPSQRVQRQYASMGSWEEGDMVLSIPSNSPMYAMGQMDRVMMLNGSDPFSINLRKGINDVLPWMAIDIQRVFWIVGSDIVEGGIPTQQADGTLLFGAGAPPDGATYSVSGTKRSEYFLFKNFPGDRAHQHGSALPLRVQLRRFDLFGR